MKTAGIIAEYNPFHCGHAYHIKQTKKETGADYIIAVMSGNFVQRGAPALLNKYERTKMALENGVDLVLELPTITALSSAEGFARGGVSILTGLGVVTDISFGCEISESSDVRYLQDVACLFVQEPSGYRQLLSSYLKQGLSFPSARMRAAGEYLGSKSCGGSVRQAELLKNPNNILAVEYLKAICKYKYTIRPCFIPRCGGAYHDPDMNKSFASATAIRNYLFHDHMPGSNPNRLKRVVPDSVSDTLFDAFSQNMFLQENDFSDLLYHALTDHYHNLGQFGCVNDDFIQRLQKQLEHFESWSQFAMLLKTKNRTYTSISRYFSHVLNGIRQEHLTQASSFRFAPYARILGFQKKAAPLLKELQNKSRIPVITSIAGQIDDLKTCQKNLLELDIRASQFYSHMRFTKSGIREKSELRQPMVIL